MIIPGNSPKSLSFFAGVGAVLVLLLGVAATASAEPVWRIDALGNTAAKPGDTHRFILQLGNIGDTEAGVEPGVDGELGTPDDVPVPFQFTAALPEKLTVESVGVAVSGGPALDWSGYPGWTCEGDGPGPAPNIVDAHNITCSIADRIDHHNIFLEDGGGPAQPVITVKVAPDANGAMTSQFSVAGGGAAVPSSTVEVTTIRSDKAAPGVDSFDIQATTATGNAFTQAAGHPYAFATTIDFNTATDPRLPEGASDVYPVEPINDVFVDLPVGFVGNPGIAEQCSSGDLASNRDNLFRPLCPSVSQVGTVLVRLNGSGGTNLIGPLPVFNMVPPSGVPARFGFNVLGVVVALNARLRDESDYGLSIKVPAISEGLAVAGSTLTMWGTPSDTHHDPERACPGQDAPQYFQAGGGTSCSAGVAALPFLRMPTTCTSAGQGLSWSLAMDSWYTPGAVLPSGAPDLSDPAWDAATIESHEVPGYPFAPSDWGPVKGVEACKSVPVKANLSARSTTFDAESSSGLEVHVDVLNPGFSNPIGIASSDIKAVKVALPQGLTINPSQAEGLGACSPAQYESSELSFHPDGTKGCPSDSKIGTVEVHTPLLEETIPGNVYIAKPYDNPFGSLIALYVVLEEPQRGVLVKLAGKVTTNEQTGRIEANFDDLPQLPFDSFDFKFREGARAPLVTPPTCGTYETEAQITGWSDPDNPITSKSSFEITRGIGGGACPAGGAPGFNPGFSAGTINNAAGAYSPFNMRLTRLDGEQNLTRFSSVLPKGVSAKIAGVAKCSDAAIAAAKGKTGLAEKASPSCPANSQIGRTTVGAGVGSVLTYVPGQLYLAGPYKGAPLSVVSITPAVAGPFDVGTVVVQEGLKLNPKTAEVQVDGNASDPIPHILKGIPLKLRDLRVYVDRPEFTFNATSCDPFAAGATLWGSGADAFNPGDDVPVGLSARYQAASCLNLGFKPRLKINLRGGTKRSAYPALRAELNARPGDANIGRVSVALPHSEFLAQSHLGTTCTRVQFAAGAGFGAECPRGSVVGRARAFTPLLDEPLEGPVFLRSNGGERLLPDLVAALHGVVDIELEGHIDSKNGGIRTTFESVPDAPVSKFVLSMQGGKKGLLENSRNICKHGGRATVQMDGQNGKIHDFRPVLKARCGKAKKRGRRG